MKQFEESLMNKLLAALLSLFLTSCSMLDSRSTEVAFHIPELPAEMQQLEVSGWRVVVT